ncbi:MAG: acetolactate decarboxylase [Bacteroidia bacterium]|nr:acetolactate decarboxylase [Bacteroidia bacterium]
MRTIILYCLIITCFFCLNACSSKNNPVELKTNSVFQYSTLSALLEGVYDGEMTIGELKKHGNYGIGTFNALDGELVLYEGECYKVTSDSKVVKVSDSEKTPFAAVCTFVPDTVIHIDRALKLKELELYVDSVVPSNNLLYAYKISGSFDSIVIRSVPKQEKPYKRLIEAYKAQGIYTFTHQDGILFGYKFPKYLKDVNMDNYHLHYLSTDKSKGGHLLNCILSRGKVSVAYIRYYSLQLPDNIYFNTATLTNTKSELLKIEGGKK